jgi:hypothetical protein
MRIGRLLMICLLTVASGALVDAAAAAGERPALLVALDGRWTMVGDVVGKPVKYDMEVLPTLQSTFTELHMTDVQTPAKYEARVFIGVGKGGEVIVHWLDSFGAQFSIPHGTGAITEDTIVFNIPYPDGQFRDTLTYRPAEQAWTLTIEAAAADGSWKHFAKYDIRRGK